MGKKVQELELGTYLSILDENGFFVEPYIRQGNLYKFPQYWTLERMRTDIGYYKAQYQGGTVDPETGEFTGGEWTDVGEPPVVNYAEIAECQRYEYMMKARYVIDPLQDAADIDEATDEELEKLKLWKKYRIALSRIDVSKAPDVTWPDMPE